MSEEGSAINKQSILNDLEIQHQTSKGNLLYWVVDPLDGTFNYIKGLPFCCVSIGLCCGMAPLLGVVYNFFVDDLYLGIVGKGSTKNSKSIHVSEVNEISKASIATGFPSKRDFSQCSISASVNDMIKYKKVRMIGSAALSLAYVAEGLVDVYKEEDIWLWDVAAGLAIVNAAGGDYRLSKLKDTFQLNVISSNPIINKEIN